MHDGDCSFSASIDADGYVTIFGIRKFVGLNAKGVYKKTFPEFKQTMQQCRIHC